MPLVTVTHNQKIFEAEYPDITDVKNLNAMGNFYRRKSINNAVLKKLESFIANGNAKIGDRILCDQFEIEFHIVEITEID